MNPVAAVLLGVTTAVGGGLLRDITANEVPQLFDPRDLYALPAFAGAASTVILSLTGTFTAVSACAVAAVVFAFRVIGLAAPLVRSAGGARLAPAGPGHSGKRRLGMS